MQVFLVCQGKIRLILVMYLLKCKNIIINSNKTTPQVLCRQLYYILLYFIATNPHKDNDQTFGKHVTVCGYDSVITRPLCVNFFKL